MIACGLLMLARAATRSTDCPHPTPNPIPPHLHACMRARTQVGNRACSSLLFLSCIGIIVPTAATNLITDDNMDPDMGLKISRGTAIILLAMWVP